MIRIAEAFRDDCNTLSIEMGMVSKNFGLIVKERYCVINQLATFLDGWME